MHSSSLAHIWDRRLTAMMQNYNALRAELLEAVDSFLAADWREARDTSLALAYLTERPQRSAVQRFCSVEESEERLALARQVEAQWASRQITFSRFQVSALLILPLPALREAAGDLGMTFMFTRALVRTCMLFSPSLKELRLM